jgi:hypothetical protein
MESLFIVYTLKLNPVMEIDINKIMNYFVDGKLTKEVVCVGLEIA